jgi:hypothetical protein
VISSDFGVWVGAFFTLAIFSYLFKGNIVFEFAEHTFIGFSAAHFFVEGYHNIINMAVRPMQEGQVSWIIPIILGVFLFARYVPSISWLSRFPVAIMVAIVSAAQIRGTLHAEFVSQIAATTELNILELSDLIFLIGVVTVATYFLYLKRLRESRVLSATSRIGRYFLMVAFGASLGTTVMGRYSLLIGRLQFLFGDWIKLIK